jgi:CRP-like cAMP-binding protein
VTDLALCVSTQRHDDELKKIEIATKGNSTVKTSDTVGPRVPRRVVADPSSPQHLGQTPLLAQEQVSTVSSGQKNLLANMTLPERDLFLAKCTKATFKRGQVLFMQGARHTTDVLVTSGVIRTYYVSPMGKEITLAYWSTGDLLGGPDFFDDHAVHIWSAHAAKDSEVLLIRGTDLAELTLRIPVLARAVIEALMFKLRWVSVLVQTLSTGSVDVRIAHLLLKLCEMFGEESDDGSVCINQHFSQRDLAMMVGATRQWVSIILSRLSREGILRLGKRRFVILDIDKLRDIGQV